MVLNRNIMREYVIDDAAGLETLALACEQLDRVHECREQIDRDGLMIRTKHGPKDHPLLKAELAARAFVSRTLVRLGLGAETIKPIGMAGFPMMTVRKRPPSRLKITDRALDLFDDMEALEKCCRCSPDSISDQCDACEKWWDQHSVLRCDDSTDCKW